MLEVYPFQFLKWNGYKIRRQRVRIVRENVRMWVGTFFGVLEPPALLQSPPVGSSLDQTPSAGNSTKRVFLWVTLFLFSLALDILSKYYVLDCLGVSILRYPHGEGIPVFEIGGIEFLIGLTFNRGAAWGFLAHYAYVLLVIRMAVVSALLVYLIRKAPPPLPFVLILAGAAGNIIDFFAYGYVIDFLLFKFW